MRQSQGSTVGTKQFRQMPMQEQQPHLPTQVEAQILSDIQRTETEGPS